MQINELAPFPFSPASVPGAFAVLPAMWDLGGGTGTAAGAVWLAEQLARDEVQELLSTPYSVAPPLRFDYPFARLDPGLLVASQTLRAWRSGFRPLWLFGDQGLAIGPVRAAGLYGVPTTVVMFDAHSDRFMGNAESCGSCPSLPNEVTQGNVGTFIGEEPAVRSLIQVGVRSHLSYVRDDRLTNVQLLSAEQIRTDLDAAKYWLHQQLQTALAGNELILLTIDLDVLDPSVCPAVDSPEEGGLNSDEFRALVQMVAQVACSIDISEFNPLKSPGQRGGSAALRLLCELLTDAAPEIGRRFWHPPQLKRPKGVLFPLSPVANAVIDCSGAAYELTPAEFALLNGAEIDALEAVFRQEAIAEAAESLRALINRPDSFSSTPKEGVESRPQRFSPIGWLEGGAGHIEGLAISTVGDRLAAADWDHGIHIWSPMAGSSSTVRYQGHQAWVIGVDFSPDGKWLASASDDGCIGLWSCDGEMMQPMEWRHDHWAKAVAWQPSGQLLASASFDGSVRIWSLTCPQPLLHINAHSAAVWSLSWSPDGKEIVSSGFDGALRRWSAGDGALLQELRGHEVSVERCRYDQMGRLWALGLTGRLTCHTGSSEPDRVIQASVSGFDLALADEMELILIADLNVVRCINMHDLSCVAELVVDFSLSSVRYLGKGMVAAAGDSERIALFEIGGM
ncbi:MAG: arginase family protein [Chromatiales bacterium]|nr:arginase family protein [Chromatiales bacterium]